MSHVSGTDSTAPVKVKHSAKEVSKKMKTKKMKKGVGADEEAGEETDEGDMESREVDYMSDSSSNSELEFLVFSLIPKWFQLLTPA